MMSVHKIVLAGFFLAATAPVFAADQATPGASGPGAYPGAVNYVEGQAALEGQPLSPRSVGNVTLKPGEILTTGRGRVEILLTPGVFLRLDNDSALKMISPNLTLTQVELASGRASVEVDEIHKENDLELIVNGVVTQLVKTGYYQFDTGPAQAMVFNGMAAVEVNDGKYTEVKGHRTFDLQATIGSPALVRQKPQKFDDKRAQDDFYKWNSLRSQYLAEANNEMAGEITGAPGWYWNPYGWGYTYIGWSPFWSPFGWGYYPFGWYGSGYYGYRRGYIAPRGSVQSPAIGGGVRSGAVSGGGAMHGGGGGHR